VWARLPSLTPTLQYLITGRPVRPRDAGEDETTGRIFPIRRVMVEQVTVLDPQARLGGFAGRLSAGELAAVDSALRAVLALD
jgi:mRNA-degrading endonuclease toxin of MazEF toxin-antitoxin module